MRGSMIDERRGHWRAPQSTPPTFLTSSYVTPCSAKALAITCARAEARGCEQQREVTLYETKRRVSP
eukprot:4823367-Prorocentrum_lima.AAC.1